MTGGSRRQRGQAGLDKLVVFIVAVLGLLLVLPTVLGLAGIDVVDGGDSEPTDPEGVVVAGDAEGPVQILGARGTTISSSQGTVGTVELTVAPAETEGTVDLREYTVRLLTDRSYSLLPEGTEGGDGTFVVENPVLANPGNQTTIRIDLIGTSAIEGPLKAGQSATVVLVGPNGSSVEHELTVPEPLPDGQSVRL